MSVEARLEHALAELEQGRINEAIQSYIDVLQASPNQPDALYMLGAIAFDLGQRDQALAFAETLTASAPDFGRGWALKGLILRAQGRVEEALSVAQKALVLDAQNVPEAWECAGSALMQLARFVEARAHFEKALGRFPDHAPLRGFHALALAEDWQMARAWEEMERALVVDPKNATALMARTTILTDSGHHGRALAAYEQDGRRDKAALYGHGFNALITGDFAKGYALMNAARISRAPGVPLWNGERTEHLALYGEQGFGDTLQFIRYARRAKEKAARVTLRVPRQLERLLSISMPEFPLSVYAPPTTSARRAASAPDPVFDFPAGVTAACAFSDLPHILGVEADTFAEAVPYLRADPALAAAWKERLKDIPRPRIGLVWSGSPQNGNNQNRSIPFAALKPLTAAARPHLISLQVGADAGAASAAGIFDAAPHLKDFADSAAALEEIDLLITVCTSTAHLAGGMGKPAFALLAFNADWRWLLGREDSPWYPHMRLYRASVPIRWDDVITRLCGDVARFVAGDRGVLTPAPWSGPVPTRHPQALALPGEN